MPTDYYDCSRRNIRTLTVVVPTSCNTVATAAIESARVETFATASTKQRKKDPGTVLQDSPQQQPKTVFVNSLATYRSRYLATIGPMAEKERKKERYSLI